MHAQLAQPRAHPYVLLKYKARTPSLVFLLSDRFCSEPTAIKLFQKAPHLGDHYEVTRYKHFIMATAEKQKERPSALRSIIAGSTAGAVEIGMLFYPVN
jgi:hypothetical protein